MLTFRTEPITLDSHVPGVRLTIGRKNGVLQVFDLVLSEFDATVAELVNRRDDLHAFFRRSGMLGPPPKPPAKKRYSPPRIRAVPPTDPRTEGFLDSLPTPMLPPPLDEKKS